MRKIKTQADIKRIRRRNNIILGVIMIVIMVISTLGYSLMSNDEDRGSRVNEFGIDFVRENGFWKMVVSNQVFDFQYLPSEVADVKLNLSANLGMYSGKVLYFVNPNEGTSEILNNIGRYVLRYQEACLENVSVNCDENLPVKNCSSNLIIFQAGNDTRVYQDENCIFIIGDSVRGVDAFLYNILGLK